MKKSVSQLRQGFHVLCVTRIVPVALGMAMAVSAHAQSTHADTGDTAPIGTTIAHPYGMHAASGSLPATLPTGVVAVVNGVPIPMVELDDAAHAAIRASGQPDSPQLRQNVKQQLIAREVLRQNAERLHYEAKPEVVYAVQMARTSAEIQRYLQDSLHPRTVTDAQVKERYEQIVESLGKDEYRPRIITVADDATASSVLAQLKAGTAFDVLARQYSMAASKMGGQLPWISFRTPVTQGNTHGLPVTIAQALTQLPVGAVTPAAIPVDNVRVIVKLDAKRPTQIPTFDEARNTIHQQLQALELEKTTTEFINSQLKGASIQQ